MTTTPDSLSIIIPVWNEAVNLTDLLPALARTCPEAEVIAVDGGSTDGTLEVVRRHRHVRLLMAERGRASQMNAGAALATGHILLFLHADTRLPAAAQRAVLDALRGRDIVGGRFDVSFDNPGPVFRMIATMMNVRSRLSGIFTGDQAIFVRRATYEALGGYPNIPLMEDIELSRRLKRCGRLACLRLRVATSARKWEQEGPFRTMVLMWVLRLLYAAGVDPARLRRWYYGGHPDGPAGQPPSPADSERNVTSC